MWAVKTLRCEFASQPESVRSVSAQVVEPRANSQRLILVPSVPLHFIDAYRFNTAQISTRKPPGNSVFDRLVNMIPADAKGLGNLFPAHPSSPASQKPLVFGRQRAQQAPAGILEDQFVAIVLETFRFVATDLVNGFVHVGHDVKPNNSFSLGIYPLNLVKNPL